MLTIGDQAPDFTLPRDGGETVSLSDFGGKKVVLFFYPKDLTPGCTKEAIAFTEHYPAFENAGAAIIGMSKDSPSRHDRFKEKYNLAVILASDETGAALEDYGVWVEKNMYGRKYMGIERATYLIDAGGKIAQIWRKVKVKSHADDVLAAAQEL